MRADQRNMGMTIKDQNLDLTKSKVILVNNMNKLMTLISEDSQTNDEKNSRNDWRLNTGASPNRINEPSSENPLD